MTIPDRLKLATCNKVYLYKYIQEGKYSIFAYARYFSALFINHFRANICNDSIVDVI